MSTKPIKKSRKGLGLVIALVVVVVGAIAVSYILRPDVRTVAAYKGPAVNAVPGSVVVREEYPQNLSSEAITPTWIRLPIQ